MELRAVKRRRGVVRPLCFENTGHFIAFTEHLVSRDWLLYYFVWLLGFLVACICVYWKRREDVWQRRITPPKCLFWERPRLFSVAQSLSCAKANPGAVLSTCPLPLHQAPWTPATHGHSWPCAAHCPCLDHSHLSREVMTPPHALGTSWPVTDQQRGNSSPFCKVGPSLWCNLHFWGLPVTWLTQVCIRVPILPWLSSPAHLLSHSPLLTALPQEVTCTKTPTQAGVLQTLT